MRLPVRDFERPISSNLFCFLLQENSAVLIASELRTFVTVFKLLGPVVNS